MVSIRAACKSKFLNLPICRKAGLFSRNTDRNNYYYRGGSSGEKSCIHLRDMEDYFMILNRRV
jgi:hypothetical protein